MKLWLTTLIILLVPCLGRAASFYEIPDIERTTDDLAKHSRADVDSADLEAAVVGLSRIVAGLPPHQFNDVLGYYLDRYQRNPEDRFFLSQLINSIDERVRPELQKSSAAPAEVFVDDVWKLWLVAYTFEVGKSAWQLRSSSLSRLFKFRQLLKTSVIQPMREVQDLSRLKISPALLSRLRAAGIMTLPAIVHATVVYLSPRKVDPQLALTKMRQRILDQAATRVARFRSEISQFKELHVDAPPESRRQLEYLAYRLTQFSKELDEIESETPLLHHGLEPIKMDIQTTLRELEDLGIRP